MDKDTSRVNKNVIIRLHWFIRWVLDGKCFQNFVPSSSFLFEEQDRDNKWTKNIESCGLCCIFLFWQLDWPYSALSTSIVLAFNVQLRGWKSPNTLMPYYFGLSLWFARVTFYIKAALLDLMNWQGKYLTFHLCALNSAVIRPVLLKYSHSSQERAQNQIMTCLRVYNC